MNTTIFDPTDISDIKANTDPADLKKMQAQKRKAEQSSEEALTHLRGLEAFYFLRLKWSWSIFVFILILILFNIALTIMIGFDKLDFSDYPYLPGIITTENFAQVIGLALIVVKFLFAKKDISATS